MLANNWQIYQSLRRWEKAVSTNQPNEEIKLLESVSLKNIKKIKASKKKRQLKSSPWLKVHHNSPSTTFSSKADNILFFSLQESAFYAQWHLNIFQSYSSTTFKSPCWQTDKCTKLISIFKTQRFQSTPFQIHPQNFPVELPFQLKGINLYALCYFTDVQHFSVILNANLIT